MAQINYCVYKWSKDVYFTHYLEMTKSVSKEKNALGLNSASINTMENNMRINITNEYYNDDDGACVCLCMCWRGL